MKKNILFLFCLLLVAVSYAQDFDVTPNPVVDFEEGYLGTNDRAGHAVMTNNTNTTKTYLWERTILCSEGALEIRFCDWTGCYLPLVGEAEFTLEGNQSGAMDLHVILEDENVEGSALVEVKVTEVGNDTNTTTIVYEYNACTPSAVEDIEAATAIQLFPNPVKETFTLTENDVVDQVIVYDLLGKQIKAFNAADSNQYDISEFTPGIYMAKLLGDDKATLKTIKLLKR